MPHEHQPDIALGHDSWAMAVSGQPCRGCSTHHALGVGVQPRVRQFGEHGSLSSPQSNLRLIMLRLELIMLRLELIMLPLELIMLHLELIMPRLELMKLRS